MSYLLKKEKKAKNKDTADVAGLARVSANPHRHSGSPVRGKSAIGRRSGSK